MSYKNKEEQRAAWRKYNQSINGRERTKRYLETHESELAKKIKEERERKLEAFCRHFSVDVWNVRRLIKMHKAGVVNIEQVDSHNAKYVFIWLSGKCPKNDYYKTTYRMKPGNEAMSFPKQPLKQPSVGSVDFY